VKPAGCFLPRPLPPPPPQLGSGNLTPPTSYTLPLGCLRSSPPPSGKGGGAQSRQSAKLFLQSSELGLPQPLTRRRVCPPPLVPGGRGTLTGERGGWRVPITTRGHTLWYSVNTCTVYVLCGVEQRKNKKRQREKIFKKKNPEFYKFENH
jgi:hypothetical protein